MSRARASSRRTPQPEDVGTNHQPRTTTAMPRPAGLSTSGQTLTPPTKTTTTTTTTTNATTHINKTNTTNATTNISVFYNLNNSVPTTKDINNNDSDKISAWTSPILNPDLRVDVTSTTTTSRTTAAGVGEKTSEDYSRLKEQFYQSYNPQVGVHTAAVLGGILGWLIIYLVYKTKVKKWIISLAKKKSHKRQLVKQKETEVCEAFAEFQEDHDLSTDPYLFQCPKDLQVPQLIQQKLWQTENYPSDYHPPRLQDYPRPRPVLKRPSGESSSPYTQCPACGALLEDSSGDNHHCPMPSIVVDSYTSLPPAESGGNNPQALSDQGSGAVKKARKKAGGGKVEMVKEEKERKKRYRRKRSQGRSRPVGSVGVGVRVVDVEEPDTKCLLPPPCSHTDSARATARWVQAMPLLMRSQLDVNGLILQVQPQMVGSHKQFSCPLISNALHCAALPFLGLPSTGWNNSMPTLMDRTLRASPTGSSKSCVEGRKKGLDEEDFRLLQPVPCCAAAVRTRSSFSHPGERSSMQALPLPHVSPPLSLRSPSPRMLTGVLLPSKQSPVSSSAANLAVHGSGLPMTSCYSAPTSPVPIPVTPKVTILRKSSSRGSRGGLPRPVQPPHHHYHNHHHHPDSEASISSSLSSFDPLTQLQPDCHCDPQPPLQQQKQQVQHVEHVKQDQADPPVALTSSRASWTVFDDEDDAKSCSGVGVGSCGREGEREGEGRFSRQNSCRSNLSSSPSIRQPGNNGNAGPHDAAWTLETKL
ncbi:hypothetical protein ACOMHN_057903 [Nucella lapillus]